MSRRLLASPKMFRRIHSRWDERSRSLKKAGQRGREKNVSDCPRHGICAGCPVLVFRAFPRQGGGFDFNETMMKSKSPPSRWERGKDGGWGTRRRFDHHSLLAVCSSDIPVRTRLAAQMLLTRMHNARTPMTSKPRLSSFGKSKKETATASSAKTFPNGRRNRASG